MSVDFTSVKKQNPWSHVKDRLLHYCLHLISSGMSFLSVISLSLSFYTARPQELISLSLQKCI